MVQTIGEVVTAELMSGLVWRIEENLRGPGDTPSRDPLVAAIKDVNNVRPMLDALHWIEWICRGAAFGNPQKDIVLKALRDSLEATVSCALAKQWDRTVLNLIVVGDLVDRLELLRDRLKKANFDAFKKDLSLFAKLSELFPSTRDTYEEHAEKEWDSKEVPENGGKSFQHVIYGHTHQAKSVYFSGQADGRVRMYVNTGTYMPLIERAKRDGFAYDHRMTMTFFYNVDEDTTNQKAAGVSADLWQGRKRKLYA